MIDIPGPPEGLTDILDNAITAHLSSSEKKAFPLRPSAAGHCSRKLAYELMDYKGYMTYEVGLQEPNVFRLLKLGNSVEYSAFKNFELCKQFEIKYKQQVVTLFSIGDMIVEGSVDGVLYSPDWRGVIDIKSSGDRFNAAYKTKWDETLDKFSKMRTLVALSNTSFYASDLVSFLAENKDVFLADNFYQLNAYCCSKFFQERNITFGSIYKYCKNDSRHYEIRFKPSFELFEQLKTKFNSIYSTIESTKNPELIKKDYSLGSMRCAFCPYSKQCWGNKDSLKSWFATFPKKKWPVDLNRLSTYDNLRTLFEAFQKAEISEKEKKPLQEAIITELLDSKIDKVKLDNGHIYVIKQLSEGLVLRRTKL